MQDWEIECADPARVLEFLDCYRTHAKTEDERFTLMALILGSYEEYHGTSGPDDDVWPAIKKVLASDIAIHMDHVLYYSCPEATNPEEWFPMTERIRELV